jgi:hypothetical protein
MSSDHDGAPLRVVVVGGGLGGRGPEIGEVTDA